MDGASGALGLRLISTVRPELSSGSHWGHPCRIEAKEGGQCAGQKALLQKQ